jgi:hypothetical protein
VKTALGLIGIVLFIVGVLALAALVTWTVVKLTPQRQKPKPGEPT